MSTTSAECGGGDVLDDRPPIGAAVRFLLPAVVTVLLAAGGGGAYAAYRFGQQEGFRIGQRYGAVEAGRRGPVPVRDTSVPEADLASRGAFAGVAGVTEAEREALTRLLNQAPSPCPKWARTGTSLATSLVDAGRACPGAEAQVPLGLAAIRSFPDPAEALSVLWVERRYPVVDPSRPARGNAAADIVITMFSDFQCPYCQRAKAPLLDFVDKHPDTKLVLRHLPLGFHPAARPAALAAEAAAEQGKFWPMAEALFDRDLIEDLESHASSSRKGDDAADAPVPWEGLAAQLDLDVAQYRSDYRSDVVEARVEADAIAARSFGVSGTPTIFVDTREAEEGRSPRVLERLVAKARAERAGQFAWFLEDPPRGVEPATSESASLALPSSPADSRAEMPSAPAAMPPAALPSAPSASAPTAAP